MNETKVPENRAYKVALILLLGLAASTTAMKELNRLHEMVSSVHQFTRQWRGTDLVTLNEKPGSEAISTTESCLNDKPALIKSSAESGLSDLIAAATDGYVESMDCEIITEAEVGAKGGLISGKRANRNVVTRTKFAPVRNAKEEIFSIHRGSKWPARFEFKTQDQTVTLELPMTMVTDIKADSIENQVSPDFVRGLLGKIDRKQSHGKTETRRRELMIKRFERNISSRRAS